MLRRRVTSIVLATLLVATVVYVGNAEPLFTVTDDGATFLYRARPGDRPASVAEMFGIAAHDLPAFLSANGIADATRVGSGFVYRIPNPPARAVAERGTTLETDKTRLTREIAQATEQARTAAGEAAAARAAAATAEARAAHAARLETLWPVALGTIVVLVLLAGGAVTFAVGAGRRQGRAERYARALATELDEKRKVALLDRQESARRVLELEQKVRTIEAQLGPRLLVGGRS